MSYFSEIKVLGKAKNGYDSDAKVNEDGSIDVRLAYSPVFDSFGRLRAPCPKRGVSGRPGSAAAGP